MVKLDLFQIFLASIPLVLSLFGGLWTLVRFLIFKPLNNIALDIKEMKELMYKMDNRVTILEYKVSLHNDHIEKIQLNRTVKEGV